MATAELFIASFQDKAGLGFAIKLNNAAEAVDCAASDTPASIPMTDADVEGVAIGPLKLFPNVD